VEGGWGRRDALLPKRRAAAHSKTLSRSVMVLNGSRFILSQGPGAVSTRCRMPASSASVRAFGRC